MNGDTCPENFKFGETIFGFWTLPVWGVFGRTKGRIGMPKSGVLGSVVELVGLPLSPKRGLPVRVPARHGPIHQAF